MAPEQEIHMACLVFCVRKDSTLKIPIVCLALKKKGVGTGCLMGYGGRIEKDEAADYATKRESFEEGEIHIMTGDLEPVALLRCRNRTESGVTFICIVKVFIARFWTDNEGRPFGEPKETDEMGPPQWFSVRTLPISGLLLGDRRWMPEWFPKLISGESKKIVVTVPYGPWQETLDGPVQIDEVDELPEI